VGSIIPLIGLSEHFLSKVIDGFHKPSYSAGVTFTFAEVVALGCKRLALSSPYTKEELELMLEPTKMIAKDQGILFFVEPKLLLTKLYSSKLTEDKTVILLAHDQNVLNDYFALKKLKEQSVLAGTPEELEIEIAERFGRLLSYDDATIEHMIKNG
jgi:hypothetical protein